MVAIRIVETMFFIGIVGSALVLILTAIDDIRELLGEKEQREPGRGDLRVQTPQELG